jgi:hypothetical protein
MQSEPWRRRSPQDEKLVAKEHDLGFATGMRSEQSHEPSKEQFDESIIPATLPHCCACASPDQIFGRHRSSIPAECSPSLHLRHPDEILGRDRSTRSVFWSWLETRVKINRAVQGEAVEDERQTPRLPGIADLHREAALTQMRVPGENIRSDFEINVIAAVV